MTLVFFRYSQYWLYPGNPFSLDVKFHENDTKIEASRFLIQAINITDTNHEKQMVRDLREICKNSPINITIFHPYFVFFDQFELVRPISIQTMVIGAFVMTLVTFIFIPDVLCVMWIAISIVSIFVGVVGYMALWDVNLDSISMINLIMCIGFSIDFTAHICYSYMSSKRKRPSHRISDAMYALGWPIVQGSVSTILGVIALLLAESYIFLVFFKMVFLVIFFGALHGLFLLPVMLSLLGPGSCTNFDDEASEDEIDFQYKERRDGKPTAHLFSITHPHLMTLASSPNGIYTSKGFNKNFKGFGNEENDLGIGTSCEESSENSSSKSQRRKAMEDENVKRRYEMGWRKSSQAIASGNSPCTFTPALDMYGNKYEDYWNSADNISNSRRDSHERPRNELQMYSGEDRDVVRNSRQKPIVTPYDDKKLHYYDHNQKRKVSNESFDKEASRKYVSPRRNIV